MGLKRSEVADLGSVITKEVAVQVLEAYRSTLKNGQLVKVNQLLTDLGKVGKPMYTSGKPAYTKVDQSITDLEDVGKSGKPASTSGKPSGILVYPKNTDLPESITERLAAQLALVQ